MTVAGHPQEGLPISPILLLFREKSAMEAGSREEEQAADMAWPTAVCHWTLDHSLSGGPLHEEELNFSEH